MASNKIPKSMLHNNLLTDAALERIIGVNGPEDDGKYYVNYKVAATGKVITKESTKKRNDQVIAYWQRSAPASSSSHAPKPATPAKVATSAKKARKPRDKTKLSRGKDNEVHCAKKGKVINLSYSKNTKTKRNVYKAMCANGATRLITRTQYERYLSRGVEGRPLPVKVKKVAAKRAGARSDVGKYCGYYGNYYGEKCMKTLGDEKACAKIKSGRTKYCTKVGARTHVSGRGTKASKTPRPRASKGMLSLLFS